jgi:hypothetical protein
LKNRNNIHAQQQLENRNNNIYSLQLFRQLVSPAVFLEHGFVDLWVTVETKTKEVAHSLASMSAMLQASALIKKLQRKKALAGAQESPRRSAMRKASVV